MKLIKKLLDLIMKLGIYSVNVCCILWLYQPEIPKSMKIKSEKSSI